MHSTKVTVGQSPTCKAVCKKIQTQMWVSKIITSKELFLAVNNILKPGTTILNVQIIWKQF